jgi:uncharacterized damage-inducible protein DinB
MPTVHQLLIDQVRIRIFKENIPRIKQCLNSLSESEIWYRPNSNSNSVGNLVLHLCGNARQWIVAGLGGQADTRDRDTEFNEQGALPTTELMALLDQTQAEIELILSELNDTDLTQEYPVQVFRESGVSILVHVIEHFSYHTGQITYFVKAQKDLDTGYYANLDL